MDQTTSRNSPPNPLLAGLSLGEIPIAGSKRFSIAASLDGQLYRIGRIPANMAFVIIRNDLRLLYVAPKYTNYRYAARKVFGVCSQNIDIDHALGRKLTEYYGFWYTLVTRLDRKVNRSHGHRERTEKTIRKGLNFSKFCYTDERILRKILGMENFSLPIEAQTIGYKIAKSHERPLSSSETHQVRWTLGMNGSDVQLNFLRPIDR